MIEGTDRKHLFFQAIVLLLVLALTGLATAANGRQGKPPSQRYEESIQKLRSGIEIRLGKLQIAGQQEFDLLGEVERLDHELSLQQVRLDVMRERRDSQKKLMAVKLHELEEAKTNIVKVKEHLQVRLRAFYLTGRTGILNVTFSTRTLPDLMFFNDAFKHLLSYDRNLFDRYYQSIEQLTQATEAHEKESALLDEFIANAVAQQEKIDVLLAEKRALLKKVRTEKVLHEQALREMQKAEADLEKTLASLQREVVSVDEGFAQHKGTLDPPVEGSIIRHFGEQQDDKVITGIVIDAANGVPIRAIYAGRILFSGYRRGYGNMVIIDHGRDYYSITARMEKIKSQASDRIKAGDVIGYAGEIATLFEPGVYFEIRHNTDPEDPMSWLSGNGLTADVVP